MIFKSCRVSPPPDLSVCFCDARQGGGAYGKTAPPRPFPVVLFCSHVLSGLSPDSVDKPSAVMRESAPLAAAPATERSERVGEEAEFLRPFALSTYAPVFLSAHVLTRPAGLSAGENAHGQAATAFASVFMVVQLQCRTALQNASVCCSAVLPPVRAVVHTWLPVRRHRGHPAFQAVSDSGF